MDPQQWERLELLFFGALEVPVESRAIWLDRECAGDSALRLEIDELLRAHLSSEPSTSSQDGARTQLDAPMLGLRLGPYRVESLLGRGGMGEVYRARRVDEEFQQEVAIKVMRPGRASGELMRRFRVERQILARLQHRGIATLLDGGVTPAGQPYLVMQYVVGASITHFADDHKLSVRERLALFRDVCQAVQFAHANLVVHRDLKPSNILVSADAQVRLLDFGIAKLLDPAGAGMSAPTTQELLMLTPEHAAPEQFLGDPVTTATDVYALGVLLYELLVGQRPFQFVAPIELHRAVIEREPARPSLAFARRPDDRTTDPEAVATARRTRPLALVQQLTGDLDDIIMMALRKEPARRYASAGQMDEDVARYLAGQPVIARPDTWGYRARKFVGRNRWGVLAAGAAAATLIGATALSSWQSHQRALALAQAEAEKAKAGRVVEFLVGVFAASDPSETRGQTVTARELLDRADERIRTELTSDSLLRADLQLAIGRSYGSLGLFRAARPLLEQSLATLRASHDSLHPDVVAAMEVVGRNRAANGDYEAATAMLQQVVEARERTLGVDDPQVAKVLGSLGRVLIDRDLNDSARVPLERALTIQLAASPRDPRALATTLRSLGLADNNTDKFEDAKRRFEEALQVARDGLAPDDPFVFDVREDLALAFESLRQPDSAIAIHRAVLADRERIYGPDHVSLSYSLHNLARVIGNTGRWKEALPYFERGIEIRERALGKSHPAVGWIVHSYAIARAQSGDLEEAAVLFQRAADIGRDALGPQHISTLNALEGVAIVRTMQGRSNEALQALETAVEGGYRNAAMLKSPQFASVATHARFRRLLAVVEERAAAAQAAAQAAAGAKRSPP